jgi:prolyl oligopeptidase
MRRGFAATTALLFAVLAAYPACSAPAPKAAVTASVPEDPFVWLEAARDPKALDWVKAENDRSLGVLQADPRFAGFEAAALKIVTASDRIPAPQFSAGRLTNFWQDAEHVQGLWRRTTLDSYRTADPRWETLIDFDALSRAEGKTWVFKGADCLPPDERLCLVSLSEGGLDAVEIREFDSETKQFVPGGFHASQSKQNFTWLDRDTVLIARDWGPGTMTDSSYPFVVKVWKRGQPIDQAQEIYRGVKTDVSVSPVVLRDPDGAVQAVLLSRGVSFFETETYLWADGKAVKLPLPLKATIHALVKRKLVFTLEQDWPEQGFKTGDLLAYDLDALKREPAAVKPVLVLRPGPRESLEGITSTRNRLVVSLYENVKGAAISIDPDTWARNRLELPQNASVDVVSASDLDDQVFFSVTGYLDPTSLWLADAAAGKVEKVKSTPARFDATGLVVDQHEAKSTDGTMIPYFVVHRAGLKLDGSNPTLLYAYGGFQVSMTPAYSGSVGKLWLERGGAYVVANIRGGGEFGPAWHNAGLKQNRQKVFDDFAAVARDLIARKITSPRRLGIEGGSNGGLLMGVEMTQHPELFHAVVIQVPLFDMLAFTHIGAGASWVGEYGDPAIPAERDFILKYSPYQALKAGQPYPEPFFETSTADDRVEPAHARKAAARMKALGYPYFYYENTEGGHAAAANLKETAKRVALEYTYLTRKLMD